MRVDNRASVAYAAASCRPGLRSKKTLMRSGCASHAWLTLCRHAGSRDAHKAIARTLMRTLGKSLRRALTSCDNHKKITYNAKASVLAARKHIRSFSASSAPACSAIARDTMHCDPSYERMAAKNARVSGSMHLPLYSKLRNSALYGQGE
jgi:hypothetical protein